LNKLRWKNSGEEEELQRGRREESSTDGATKPPTSRLAMVEVAEQALARHEAADATAGRGGGGGASPRT
jgi:hypothetical protein